MKWTHLLALVASALLGALVIAKLITAEEGADAQRRVACAAACEGSADPMCPVRCMAVTGDDAGGEP